jgi:hypothetical protein
MSILNELQRALPGMGFTVKQAFNFCRKLRPEGPHLIWIASQDEHGTGQFGANGKMHKAHRVVFAAFNPSLDITGKYVTQSCGISCCCAPKCLVVLDKKPSPGESHGRLGDHTVRYLKSLPYDTNKAELARNHGVSRSTIVKTMRGNTWKHLNQNT